METWKLILLIVVVLGAIIGNIMLLKQTAGFKLDKRLDEFKHGKKISASTVEKDASKNDDQPPPTTRV